MFIRKSKSWQISESEVTPERLYLNRRKIMAGAGALAATGLAGCGSPSADAETRSSASRPLEGPLEFASTGYRIDDPNTPFEIASGYNNFYEFGMGKGDPARYAHAMTTDPWSITVNGLADRTGVFALEDVIDFSALEERIYRLRCVEAWSMVIPWIGVPLRDVLSAFGPQSGARYIAFETYANRDEMRNVRSPFPAIPYPYVEGLRMDEAMNELAFLAVGMYGRVLPNQNGAPVRLVVPWKYGYKSIKSIVRISFVEDQPPTTWNISAPHEYGFYSNVNPNRAHPRWSQESERVIGGSGLSGLFARRETEMFNGYGEQVADLYAGMDLIENH